MTFATWILRKFDMKILQIGPSHLSDVATLPWKIQKKVIFNSIIHTYFWLFRLTLSQKKTNCSPLAHPTCKWHYINLWIAKLFSSDWRFVAFFQTLETPNSQLWVVVGGSEKNRLWRVATGMSGKQCHSKCSEWPTSACFQSFSTLISRIEHHAVLKFSRKPQHDRIFSGFNTPKIITIG